MVDERYMGNKNEYLMSSKSKKFIFLEKEFEHSNRQSYRESLNNSKFNKN